MLIPAKIQFNLIFWKVLNFGLLLLIYWTQITAYTPRVLLPNGTLILMLCFTIGYGILLVSPALIKRLVQPSTSRLIQQDLNLIFASYALILIFLPTTYTQPNLISRYGVLGFVLTLISLPLSYLNQPTAIGISQPHSAENWRSTNLLKARLLVSLGLVIMVAATSSSRLTWIVSVGGISIVTLITRLYSSYLAKQDL